MMYKTGIINISLLYFLTVFEIFIFMFLFFVFLIFKNFTNTILYITSQRTIHNKIKTFIFKAVWIKLSEHWNWSGINFNNASFCFFAERFDKLSTAQTLKSF